MNALLVGVGAFFGGVSRYGLGQLISKSEFPWATLLINISGSFLLGLVAAVWGKDHPLRLLLGVGFLGGYTTFSNFSLEVLEQLRSDQPAAAVTNIAIQVIGGVVFCALGYALGSKFPGGG